ncbi:MAG: tRNA preQ1(34) S-adenosylmethionine ribosyltransferase-isomerase QueA [Mesorhizobium amorphae]|nr:MAG: tRNA preQ1(34) S-adenosylmethionine ribosyltransferase-isomerase QueA [Mesorhizobium amorphae]
MRVDAFDFELPESLIALRPAEPRATARLLTVGADGALGDRRVGDLPDLLRAGDLLVFNDTKVIPAQLEGLRQRGENAAKVSATLHRRVADDAWEAFLRPGKRVAEGDLLRFGMLEARVEEKSEGGIASLRFDRAGPALDSAIAEVGHVPLPPYIASRRGDDAQDRADYQTVYAREEGAVAAPTAGLHFTEAMFERLAERGIGRAFVTLHVGAGTFLPVKVEDTADHRMHFETGSVSQDAAEAIAKTKRAGGRVLSVGTTSLRILESAVDAEGVVRPWAGSTDIFITPGYRFRTADMLFTNFHLPRSTLMMLVSAFSGLDAMRAAYAHAIARGYRFYSYGDASLLERSDP